MSESDELIIHTDGASRGNPGDAAFAYTIERDGEEIIEEAGCLGKMTNNQAEYTALVRALEHALQLGPKHRVVIYSDSELMVKQMRGEYKVKNEELRDLYQQASRIAQQFTGRVRLEHVRRGDNRRADQLCNEALDGKREASPEALLREHSARQGNLNEEAIRCLTNAQAQPSPELVWKSLVAILERHGMRLPSRK